ncbi:MAG TPA: phosphate signaling complex protein PhoU [Xanthobacteraceae bacterium]|nr:phosphate signaling complex protein PhoU [Xanthobacteraceae bacterium]
MPEHTISAFDADLQALARMISEMGGLAEKQVIDSISALDRNDVALARRIIADDAKINAIQHAIEEKVVFTIARRQPMAADLREIIAALRISNDLERIGDLAKNIAKRVSVLGDEFQPRQIMRGVEHMADLVLLQLKNVLDSYARRDVEKAVAVWRGDAEIDAVNNSLLRELLTYMIEEPRIIGFCIHLMFCTKNIERMGDHATNIAEIVYYMIEGKMLPDDRPKGDITTSFSVPIEAARKKS